MLTSDPIPTDDDVLLRDAIELIHRRAAAEPPPELLDDVEAVLDQYDAWWERRCDVSERENTGDVDSDEWHDSDDEAVDMLQGAVGVMRRLLVSHARLTPPASTDTGATGSSPTAAAIDLADQWGHDTCDDIAGKLTERELLPLAAVFASVGHHGKADTLIQAWIESELRDGELDDAEADDVLDTMREQAEVIVSSIDIEREPGWR